MDRKIYLEKCRQASMAAGNPQKRCKVRYDGNEYYPQEYLLGFRQNGTVIHTAVLHDVKANAVCYVPLDKVE